MVSELAGVGVDPLHVGVDVQPVLVGEVAERVPEQASVTALIERLHLREVRPPGLGRAGIDIADDPRTPYMQRLDGCIVQDGVVLRRVALAVLQDVDVEDRRCDRPAGRERCARHADVDEPGARVATSAMRTGRPLQLVLPPGLDGGLPTTAGRLVAGHGRRHERPNRARTTAQGWTRRQEREQEPERYQRYQEFDARHTRLHLCLPMHAAGFDQKPGYAKSGHHSNTQP